MSSRPGISFVLPAGSERLSGGNLYNAGLLQALGEVRRIQAADWLTQEPGPGTQLVDTLNLQELIAAAGKRVPGQRFVLLVHHLPSLEPGLEEGDPSLDLERRALALCDGFVATSEYARELLLARGLGPRVLSLPPPMPELELGGPPEGATGPALMVGNLIARKGIAPFVEALAELCTASDAFHIDIAGRQDMDSEYSARCRAAAQRSSLAGRVRLCGAIPHADLDSHYRGASVFLSAAAMETFGIALQEARHYGLPILSVRGGNSENHVAPGCGLVVEEPGSLARAFLGLIRDPSSLQAMRVQAFEQRPPATEAWPELARRLRAALSRWFCDA